LGDPVDARVYHGGLVPSARNARGAGAGGVTGSLSHALDPVIDALEQHIGRSPTLDLQHGRCAAERTPLP